MSGRQFTDEVFDEAVMAWLDDRAQGPSADQVLDRVVSITARTRPLPAWRSRERWLPARAGARATPVVRRTAFVVLILLLLAAVAYLAVGSRPRLPPPFGLAAPGVIAFVSDGHVWTANPDGSLRVQLTNDPRTDGTPQFSRDGTRIAFKRLPVANSRLDWEDWGDVMVADADGRNAILIDADVHSPSPVTWSTDSQFIVYSRTVEDVDQVIVAAADGSSTRIVTSGTEHNWAPTFTPDGTMIQFVRGYPDIDGLYVIGVDGSGERRITTGVFESFCSAEWSPDGRTLAYCGAATGSDGEDIFVVGLDGSSERSLISAPLDDLAPTWSPTGRQIAYLNTGPEGSLGRVLVADADGRNAQPISDYGNWYAPQWSPDELHVLAVDGRTGGGQPIVAILDPSGHAPASSFALPDVAGLGRADQSSWQRLALP